MLTDVITTAVVDLQRKNAGHRVKNEKILYQYVLTHTYMHLYSYTHTNSKVYWI